VQYLVLHIGDREEIKFRQSFYANKGVFNEGQLRAMLNDLAVTTNLHPTSLGIQAQEAGTVWVGSNVRIKLHLVQNVYTAASTKANAAVSSGGMTAAQRDAHVEREVLKGCRQHTITKEQPIPCKIWKLECPRAPSLVIVLEHRNVGTALKWLEQNASSTIIIMVWPLFSLPLFASNFFPSQLLQTLPLS
jgi:hypothetical protein